MIDPYKTLGVSRRASADRIRAAYRKLALKHHPDRGGDAEKFQAVTEAHDLLSDPDRRARYDATGETDVARQGQAFAEIMSVLSPCLFAVLEAILKNGGDVKKENVVEHMRTAINGHGTELKKEIAGWRSCGPRSMRARTARRLPRARRICWRAQRERTSRRSRPGPRR